jgi:hypothetical protein
LSTGLKFRLARLGLARPSLFFGTGGNQLLGGKQKGATSAPLL